MIKKIELKTFQEDLYCESCGGQMFTTNIVLASYPAKYPHECVDCGEVFNVIGHSYPRITYEVIK
jgi:uncharacterized Zn finger protein